MADPRRELLGLKGGESAEEVRWAAPPALGNLRLTRRGRRSRLRTCRGCARRTRTRLAPERTTLSASDASWQLTARSPDSRCASLRLARVACARAAVRRCNDGVTLSRPHGAPDVSRGLLTYGTPVVRWRPRRRRSQLKTAPCAPRAEPRTCSALSSCVLRCGSAGWAYLQARTRCTPSGTCTTATGACRSRTAPRFAPQSRGEEQRTAPQNTPPRTLRSETNAVSAACRARAATDAFIASWPEICPRPSGGSRLRRSRPTRSYDTRADTLAPVQTA